MVLSVLDLFCLLYIVFPLDMFWGHCLASLIIFYVFVVSFDMPLGLLQDIFDSEPFQMTKFQSQPTTDPDLTQAPLNLMRVATHLDPVAIGFNAFCCSCNLSVLVIICFCSLNCMLVFT